MKGFLLLAAFLTPGTAPLQVQFGVITGQVLSRDGKPAAGVRVSAMPVGETESTAAGASTLTSIALTDNEGRYRLENVSEGRYYVVAGLVDSPTYFPGAASIDEAKPVEVSAGVTLGRIDFSLVLSAGVTVSGSLVLPPDAPPVPRRIVLRGGRPSLGLEATANADGSFQFMRVRPGSYQLVVQSPGALSQPITVVVADKDITGLQAVVALLVPIRTSLEVEGNGLRPRLPLTFSPFKGGVNVTNLVLANGTTSTRLPEGEYRVGWSSLPSGYQVKSIMSGSVDLLTSPLVLASGAAIPPIIVTLGVSSPPPWVKVRGRVTGSSTGSLRLMLSGGQMETLEVPVNADGSFEFQRVLPGVYTARIMPPLPIPPVSLTVPNTDLADVQVPVPFLKDIAGRVEGADGTTVGMMFTLNSPPGAPRSPSVPSRTSADPQGTFQITWPEGEYRILLNVPGFVVQSLTYGSTDLLREAVKVSRADSAELRAVLARSGRASAVVPFGVAGGVTGGIVVGPPPPPGPPPPRPPIQAVSIDPNIAQANLLSSAPPSYPPLAQAAGVRGIVVLSIVISANGTVDDLKVIAGHPLLNQAAIDAVQQWRYRPQVVSGQPGQPAAVQTTVTLSFP